MTFGSTFAKQNLRTEAVILWKSHNPVSIAQDRILKTTIFVC